MEPVGPFATPDGNLIQEEAAFTLNECYKKAFTPRKQETIPTEDWLQDENEGIEENTPRLYNIHFSTQDIEDEIEKCSQGSPGPDGLTPNIMKKLSTILSPYLSILYRKMLENSSVPQGQRWSHIAPLLKPGKPPSRPESYRPVALTSIISRIFERLVRKAITNHLEEHLMITEEQSGFRNQRSTISNILKTQIHNGNSQERR